MATKKDHLVDGLKQLLEVDSVIKQAGKLTEDQVKYFNEKWEKMGKVKKRWAVYVAGVVSGALVASALWLGGLVLFGCGQEPKAVQTGPNSACFPGPRVIE